jgi:type I restriction enzyme R subunit
VNDTEEIRRSFAPYYESTTIGESADPQRLYELAHQLESAQVFWRSEVEAFCKVFFAPEASVKDHGAMNKQLGPGLDRYAALDEAARDAFKDALSAFVRLYAFLSQVMPFSDPDLEKLYTFARFFEAKLPQDPRKAPLRLDGDVALKYYRLDKIGEGRILLVREPTEGLKGPTETGSRKANDEEVRLSEIIHVLNERFGTEFDPADQVLFDQFVAEAKLDAEIVQQAKVNELDNFALAMRTKVMSLMADRMEENEQIVTRFLNDAEFQGVMLELLVKRIYEEIRRTAA